MVSSVQEENKTFLSVLILKSKITRGLKNLQRRNLTLFFEMPFKEIV